MKAGKKYRTYSQAALTDAYNAVKTENVSVCRASKKFWCSRTNSQRQGQGLKGIIHVDCVTTGRSPVLSMEEEAKLVNHLKSVANYGYGYFGMEVVDLTTDYGIQLGKRTKENPFTLNWFVKFIKRWPELRVLKPRALEVQRAKCTSEAVVSNYFNELENILDIKYNLKTKPHLIYNVDEKGISQNRTPPHIVGTVDNHPQAVTAGKSQTTTIIGCVSASGSAIPLFLYLLGKE
jgi:hypothetical protein